MSSGFPAVVGRSFFEKAFLQFAAFWLGISSLSGAALPSLIPNRLSFEARQDDPLLLSVSVDLGRPPEASLDARLAGLNGDYRITDLGRGEFRVEVAPDTTKTGSVSGQLELWLNDSQVASVPISGSVFPWIRVQPSRIFLGSIGKGETFAAPRTFNVKLSAIQPFDVRNIEWRNLPHAQWKCTPPPGEPATQKTIALTLSPDALADGFPYGALAIKSCFVETTHPQARFLTLPIQGMLSVNTTGRDYSQYLYKGNVRWEGAWSTPNMAAAFLAGLLTFLCGTGAALHRKLSGKSAWLRLGVAIGFFIPVGIGSHYLVQTYSRGGWTAAMVGLVVLFLGARGARIYPVALGAVFVFLVALHPQGMERATTATDVTGDKSITHRLLLWQGALQMMAEHPWSGVGPKRFGEVFAKDYQLPQHTANYTTAINDFLTLGTERGAVLLALAVSTIFTLSILGFFGGLRYGSILLVTGSAITATQLISSWFSSIAFQSNSVWWLIAALVGIGLGLAWFRRHALFQTPGRTFRRLGSAWLGTFLALGALLFLSCFLASVDRPRLLSTQEGDLRGLLVTPGWGKAKGRLLYLGDRGTKPIDLLQTTLRPLARQGWSVFCPEIPNFPSTALALLRANLSPHEEKPPFDCLAGDGQGAQLAMALGRLIQPRATAGFNPPPRSPFPDISPELLIRNFPGPLLLCTAETSDNLRLEPIWTASLQANLRQNYLRIPQTPTVPNLTWRSWIEAVTEFASNQLPSPPSAKR